MVGVDTLLFPTGLKVGLKVIAMIRLYGVGCIGSCLWASKALEQDVSLEYWKANFLILILILILPLILILILIFVLIDQAASCSPREPFSIFYLFRFGFFFFFFSFSQ